MALPHNTSGNFVVRNNRDNPGGLSALIAAIDQVTPRHRMMVQQPQQCRQQYHHHQQQQRSMIPQSRGPFQEKPTVVSPDTSSGLQETSSQMVQLQSHQYPRQMRNNNNRPVVMNPKVQYVPAKIPYPIDDNMKQVFVKSKILSQHSGSSCSTSRWNHFMIQIQLQRPSSQIPWGITLCKMDPSSLVIGFVKYLSHHVRSGDIIKYINGQPVVRKSLPIIIQEHLLHPLQLTLWVQRDPSLPFPNNTMQPQSSLVVARQAYDYIRRKQQQQQKQQAVAVKSTPPPPPQYRNSLFRDYDTQDKKKSFLVYDDDYEFAVDDGSRAKLFLPPIPSNWLQIRKATWRTKWKGQLTKYVNSHHDDNDNEYYQEDDDYYYTNRDFWTAQGFTSFDEWKMTRIHSWKQSYSWNQRKRKRLEEATMVWRYDTTACEQNNNNYDAISIQDNFEDWLGSRKRQWNVLRRKRQRAQEQQKAETTTSAAALSCCCPPPPPSALHNKNDEMLLIDSVLEEQERQRQQKLATFDLNFVFDAAAIDGAPDDIIFTIFSFLTFTEQTSLLQLNKKRRSQLQQRDMLWRQLCLTQQQYSWTLPRRPRKAWHLFYVTKMVQQLRDVQKRSDDILLKAVQILRKGDFLQAIQKLVLLQKKKKKRSSSTSATTSSSTNYFDVNYVSGVVCERNSLLNLAIIYGGRTKVVKWLIEECGADLESTDRGGFTPLLNAVYDGHSSLVRYLLGKGCNRHAKGAQHSTKPLAPPDFEGLTAKGWALKQGHDAIAHLLHVGL